VTEFVHQACIYRSDNEFLAMAVPFTTAGLARGEPVLAVTRPTNIELLEESLGADAARVRFVDAHTWYRHPPATLSAYDRYVAARRGSGCIRIIGEPVWPAGPGRRVTEWKRYESVINIVFAAAPAWIVCPYDERLLDPAIVADARRTHPALVSGRDTLPCPEFVHPADFFAASEHLPLPEPPPYAAVLPCYGDLRAVRRFVATQAARHGLTPEPAALFMAAVGEAVTYLLDQGSGRALVRMWARPEAIVCDVADRAGRITDPFPGYRPPADAARPDDGLWLTRQVCELVQVQSGESGSRLRLHVTRGRSAG
jgi:DcmR-like sensory protein/histidine kinase-like protein